MSRVRCAEIHDGTFDLPREDLRRQTGKVAWSKFAPEWGLQQLVDWLENFLVANGWPFQPGDNRSQSVRLAIRVGVVNGEWVHTIRVVSDGHYVHAYPVEDEA